MKIALGILLAVVLLVAFVRLEVRADVEGSETTPSAVEEPAAAAMLAAEAELALQDSEWARANDVAIATCYPDGEPVDGEAFDRFRCVLYDADFDELDERAYIAVTGPGTVEVVAVR